MPDNGFVNLHNHSDYSILDGYSHPGEYVKRAAELGQTAVGLTDHGNLFGAFDFIKSARNLAKTYDRKNHPQTPVFIKPIIGIEAYMAPQNPDGAKCKSPVLYSPELREIIERKKQLGYTSRKKVEKLEGDELQLFKDMEARERELRSMDVSSRGAYTHLTLIAINDIGFHNLIHLTTEASKREHYYQHGRMDFDMLTKWNEGIIATTGCPSGEIQTRLRLGQKDEAYDYAQRMAELFKDRYYVELMLHNMPSDLESSMIPQLKQLADDLNLPLLATNDSHYARPEDAIHHEEMLCVQTNSRGGGEGGKGYVTMNCLKNDDPAPDRMISIRQKDGSYKQVAQPRRFAFQGDDYYLKTYDEMIKAFPEDKYPGAVSNTVKIADMVGDWWMKPGTLDLDKLEADYKAELEECRSEIIDSEGNVTLPHATGGRTNRLNEANKGFVALGDTPDPTNVTEGFKVDSLTQKLIDDGKISIGAYDLSLNTDLRPEIQIPEGWTEEEWFKKKINEGFIQRRVAMGDSDEILEDSKRRIADEYPVFAGKNFIQYMLVVQDYINWAREHGVSVGEGRGSVGGSEIAYLMDISRTDPVRHDLLFERFLNPERNSPPDVDTDFKASVRNRVLQYAKDKYGYDKVANIITFGTFQFKQAFRDVAKIYQMTNSEVDRISKLIPDPIDRVAPTMHDLYDPKSPFYAGAEEFRKIIASNKDWEPIIDSTDKISGRVRQTGTHACGVIMSSKPISDYAPLFWTPDEKKAKANIWTDCMVGWEYPDLESIGLIKMDFLPLSTLDLIDDTIDNIKSYNDTIEELARELEDEGEIKKAEAEESRKLPVPNLDNIEVHGLEDEGTFKMLASGDSDAVFQLGSDGQKALLRRIEPDQFEDIVAINALYRPGPMGMNAHLEYADRKNGRAPAYIIDEKLDKVFRGTPVSDVLGPTYGLCVPAGTPILDCTTGKYVPIEDFPIGHKTISFNEETNKWNNNEVSDVFHTGMHDIVQITTRNHKVVEVADTHPLLTQRGWVRAGELLESDSLVMSDGLMDEKPNDSGLTPDLAWFLGVMLGDGSMTGEASVIITTADQPIINEVERIITDNFDNIDVEIKVKSNKNVKYINLCNRDRTAQGKYDRHKARGAERNQVNQFLSRYGYHGKILMYDKTLTDEVLRSSNEILAHVVSGLWDTDGTCKKNEVHYTTTAPGLYHGMRLMLDRIGVKYGVMETPYHNEKRLDRTAYRIYPNMEDFDRKIVPLLRLKSKDFNVSRNVNMNPDRIPRVKDPVRFKSEIIDACKAWIRRDTNDPLAVEAKRLADAKRKKCSSGWMLSDESFCNDILREAARNLGMEIPSEHTTGDRNKAQDLLLLYPKAITPNLRKKLDRSYSPIASIQIVGEHECWDMTVENDHTYMINGFVGHNCIYQESVMQISRLLCGFTRGQADSLRKAIGHKIPEEMEANHKRFVDGAMKLKEENGWIFSRSDVEALWSYIEKFASYGFNRSHSVSYAIDAYKTAYLKANYYPFFMASCMTSDLNNKDKFAVYLRNVENRGLKVGPININHSNKGIQAVAKKSPNDPDIVFGFDKATGVNAELADEITRTREKTLKGEFKSFDEFMMNMSDVNAGALTGLANAGAFDDFGVPRKAIAKNAKDIVDFYKKKRNAKKKVSTSLFGMLGGSNANYDAMGDYDFKLSGDLNRDEYSLTSKLKAEKDSLSVYVSAFPMSNAGPGLDVMRRTPYYWRAMTVEEVSKLISENASVDGNNTNGKNRKFFRKDVRMIGWFSDLAYKKYRSGTGVFFMGTFTDKTGNLGISVNGELAEQMAAAVGLRPLDDNPLDGKFPVPTFYKSGELNTVKRGGSKLTVDEQVERLTDVLVDVTMQITNDRVKVKSLDLVPTTPDGRVPLTLRLKSDKGASNRKFLKVLEIMKSHPGDTPVVVDVQNMTDPSSHPTLMGVPVQAGPNNVLPFGVDLSEEMINEVSKLRDPDDFFMSWSAYEAASPYDPINQ